MKNLKQIRDALNKLPEDGLEECFITHKMWMEDPDTELGVVWCADEEKREKFIKIFESAEIDVLIQFARDLNSDSLKIAAAKLDEDLIEKYGEDSPTSD